MDVSTEGNGVNNVEEKDSLHKVNTEHHTSLSVPSCVETRKSPVQNDGGANDTLQPTHGDECKSVLFNANCHDPDQAG